jgi:hypothetical protein
VDDQLLRRILDGDDPAVLVAVALAAVDRPLGRAAALAADARTRRALAYLGGDHDRALLLARDHLADHPADLLVAHVAALANELRHDPSPYRRRDGRRRAREPGLHRIGNGLRLPGRAQAPARGRPRRIPRGPGRRSVWFLLLALGAALLAPVAIGVGRLPAARAMRLAVPVGVAAATVQVVGLLRSPLPVPGWAAENDVGTLVGETFGYLTALWTGLVLGALRARFAGRAFVALGGVAAALILMGGLSPLALPLVDLANFGGYVLWSARLLIFAAVLVRRGAPQSSRA